MRLCVVKSGKNTTFCLKKLFAIVNLPFFLAFFSSYVREFKTVLDSGLHAVDSGFQVLDSRSFSVDLGFRIPIVSGISGFLQLYSGFEGPGFRIPQTKISRIPSHRKIFLYTFS